MPWTMKDIASMLGVSESTVSRAINGKSGVGQKTRQKILDLVDKYNFQPNSLAKGLASKQTCTLGLILPDITDLHQTLIVKGIEERASELGYHLILANTGRSRDKEMSYLALFQQNWVDGIVVVEGSLAEVDILKLGLNKYPLVLVNRLLEELTLPTLLVDHQYGAKIAINHLIDKGHQCIGLLIGSLDDLVNYQLYEGYQEALLDAGFSSKDFMLVEVQNSHSGGYKGFLQFLKKEELPTAIFAAGDLIAVGVVEAIKMGGYLIPEEIAVVCYGDTKISQIIHPPLTSVKIPLDQLGKRAIDQLVKVIQKAEIDEPFEVVFPKLVQRKST